MFGWPKRNLLRDLLEKQNQNLEISRKLLKHMRKVSLLEESFGQRPSSSSSKSQLTEGDALGLLDICDNLMVGIENQPGSKQLLETMKQKILDLARLTPVAKVGQIYNSSQFKVMDSQFEKKLERGTVMGIISQGYTRSDSSLVRMAKVIVSTDYPLS